MTRKLFGAVGTLVFVLVFNFFLFRVVESDPVATLFRGTRLTEDQRARLYDEFGVNDPLPEQFAKYVRETSQLNFGYSYEGHRPVRSEIGDALWPTVWLVGLSTLLSTVIGLALGVYSGWRRGTRGDYASTAFSMFTYSMPDFWLGLLLLGFLGSQQGWFPTGGISDPGVTGGLSKLVDQAHHLVLPCLTLTVAYLGEYAIVMRSSLLDTLGEDYLLLARAKGLRDALVRRRHAVPNALLPVVTLVAINFGFVLSGAIAVESIFSWPGLGHATFRAIPRPTYRCSRGSSCSSARL
ncbi:MAG: ABC transporter permease [Acidimicrobiia bacterium]|nr:ABC transporter permease [Acidimicrobiia bacterium]